MLGQEAGILAEASSGPLAGKIRQSIFKTIGVPPGAVAINSYVIDKAITYAFSNKQAFYQFEGISLTQVTLYKVQL